VVFIIINLMEQSLIMPGGASEDISQLALFFDGPHSFQTTLYDSPQGYYSFS
jgi:hypothetical protein